MRSGGFNVVNLNFTHISLKQITSITQVEFLLVDFVLTSIPAPLSVPFGSLTSPKEIRTPRFPNGTYSRYPFVTEAPPRILSFFQTGFLSVMCSESKPSTESSPSGKSQTTSLVYRPWA